MRACTTVEELLPFAGCGDLDEDSWVHSVDILQSAFVPPRNLEQFWRFTVSDSLSFLEQQEPGLV